MATQSSAEGPGGVTFVELIRLGIVVLATVGSLELASNAGLEGTNLLAVTALGAGIGYVAGGVLGRFTQGRIDRAERRLQRVSAPEIVAGSAGMLAGVLLAAAVVWPSLLFGGKVYTVPLAAMVVTTAAWTGLRVGRNRAGDLLRFIGAGGRLPSNTNAKGGGYKLVDTSALIDGRLVDVAREGWLEGVLVVPEFVLYELQGLADSGEPERRRRGQRGLDMLAALQRLSGIGVEVLEDDPGGTEVDTKLAKVAKQRDMPLVTTDSNLARLAEVQGIRVRNLHQLANSLRPPVQPGDVLEVRVSKEGREPAQGVGYLPDGTMVVVEQAAEMIGSDVQVEVTSIMANERGRMLFASPAQPPGPSRPRLLRGDAGG